MTKRVLINWLIEANDNNGKFWYFRNELSEAEFRKQLERFRKDELITMVYDDSVEGQKFLEIEKLIREQAYYASIEDYDRCFEIEYLLEMLS